MPKQYNIKDYRHPEHEITPLILERWSPRALSGEMVSDKELMSLFEAAKWAPSCFNNQSWRFIYAKNNTPVWDRFFSLLTPSNQSWTKRAAFLVLVISKQTFDYNGQLSRTASFDTGAAWENLALEARRRGLVAHAMAGFDYDQAKTDFKIPDDYKVEAMVAIGRPGEISDLDEKQQAGEFPSDRKKLAEIISEGEFKF